MQLSNRWHVQLGEGGRRMTDSQVNAAAARSWIDAETPVRKPQSSEWTKLGDVAPAKRITEEPVADIDTSAMILVSGQFEVVDDEASPSKEELASARPPRLAPKLFALAVVLLAGGGLLARGRVPKLDAELDAMVAAMRPAPVPTVNHSPAAPAPAPTPIAMTVTSSATIAIVPKMRAPAPKMPEPSPPKTSEPPAPKKAAAHAKAPPKRATRRH
jgi:hypothetical protein